MGMPAIQAQGLGKRYRLGEAGYVTLREKLAGIGRRRDGGVARDEVWAIRDLDLEIGEGDVVGIVGRNGAGKTTFLKTVAGIVRPTTGLVRVCGRVGALLEVGTGFHPELTGRENVFLNGVVLGMSRREVRRRFDEIVEFAGVERFLDTPLKRYSSGMYLRLAFAVAAHIDPDVLIVDEVLAVGDAEFQRKCLGRMSEFAGEGRTVLFVSHDTGAVRQLCERAVWLEQGTVREDGAVEPVLARYLESTVPRREAAAMSLESTGAVEDVSVELLTRGGASDWAVRRNQPITLVLRYSLRESVFPLDASLYLSTPSGARTVNENASDTGNPLPASPGRYELRLTIPPVLEAGEYVVGAWIGTDEVSFVHQDLGKLSVLPLSTDSTGLRHGLVRSQIEWTAS